MEGSHFQATALGQCSLWMSLTRYAMATMSKNQSLRDAVQDEPFVSEHVASTCVGGGTKKISAVERA